MAEMSGNFGTRQASSLSYNYDKQSCYYHHPPWRKALRLEAAPLVTPSLTSTVTQQESTQGKETMAGQPNWKSC